jgi:hypothetical protein
VDECESLVHGGGAVGAGGGGGGAAAVPRAAGDHDPGGEARLLALRLHRGGLRAAGDDQARLPGRAGARGKKVQVDPIEPTLKAPGSERLKLKCDDLLSNFAFKFN